VLNKIEWVTFIDTPNVNSNSLPNHVASNGGVSMIEVRGKDKVLRVSIKRLYNMLVQSGFLKVNVKYHLEKGDYCKLHERKGHCIENCIEFCQRVVITLTIEELRIEDLESSHEVRMMESQEK